MSDNGPIRQINGAWFWNCDITLEIMIDKEYCIFIRTIRVILITINIVMSDEVYTRAAVEGQISKIGSENTRSIDWGRSEIS
jgi:hypothetical protein